MRGGCRCPAAATEKLKRYLLDNHIVTVMSLKPQTSAMCQRISGVREVVPVVCDDLGKVPAAHPAGDFQSTWCCGLRKLEIVAAVYRPACCTGRCHGRGRAAKDNKRNGWRLPLYEA